MKKVDYLIVGQGIAGTALAFQLRRRGKSVVVVDKGHSGSSSYMAAGVINPLVLKRLTLSWRAEEFIQYDNEFYTALDNELSISSYHPTPLHKLISSKDEEAFWEKRYKTAGLEKMIQLELESHENSSFVESFKEGKLFNTAWVDLKLLLSSWRNKLVDEGSLIEEAFDHMKLETHEYGSIHFDKVVFCEGSNLSNNPFFNYLSLNLNKGEILTLKSEELELTEMYKKKVFVIPLGNQLFRVGATYDRDFQESYDEESKREELIQQFQEIFKCKFEVVEQLGGIRPAVRDRRPYLGKHPVLKNFYIFNGLGSRGCLMAPKLSEELIDCMEEEKALSAEIDIERVMSKNN